MSEARPDPVDGEPIYAPEFVTSLFDEMSETYGVVNSISSFGFCHFWRSACARLVRLEPGARVVDLMSGMCELSLLMERGRGRGASYLAIDASPAMCDRGRRSVGRRTGSAVQVIQGDALATGLVDDSVDAVVSTFGLKTFSGAQLERLAREVHRVLRPGGQLAFLEISVPPAAWLRVPYLFYLDRLIPVIGRLLMGNPDNYRLLGEYTRRFGSCDRAVEVFRGAGLTVEPRRFFFGCATGFRGSK